jgi:hypothetical protein
MIDPSMISGFAALAGAAIEVFTQRTMVQAQWVSSQALRRQGLYRVFIEIASKCYIDALRTEKPDISDLVGLYAAISRMRVLSSTVLSKGLNASRKESWTPILNPTRALRRCETWP